MAEKHYCKNCKKQGRKRMATELLQVGTLSVWICIEHHNQLTLRSINERLEIIAEWLDNLDNAIAEGQKNDAPRET